MSSSSTPVKACYWHKRPRYIYVKKGLSVQNAIKLILVLYILFANILFHVVTTNLRVFLCWLLWFNPVIVLPWLLPLFLTNKFFCLSTFFLFTIQGLQEFGQMVGCSELKPLVILEMKTKVRYTAQIFFQV